MATNVPLESDLRETYCEQCTDVLANLEKSWKLRSWRWKRDELEINHCSFCRFLFDTAEKTPWLSNLDSGTSFCSLGFEISHARVCEPAKDECEQLYCLNFNTWVCERIGGHGAFILPSISARADEGHQAFRMAFGRHVQPQTDFSLVRQWYETCQRKHLGCSLLHRHGLLSVQSVIPHFRLVDIQMQCLVETDPAKHYTYAALSYVWGTGKRLLLTKDTLQWLSVPNVLSSRNKAVPMTFRDAITVANRLGIPYIWIDAICVQQDHEEQLNEHMDSMASIYGSATLTIVSNTDNAWTGIPGVSFPRDVSQTTFRHAGKEYIRCQEQWDYALYWSPWENRAWCLQEGLFSKRLILFTPSQTFYCCRIEQLQEGLVLPAFEGSLGEAISHPHGGRFYPVCLPRYQLPHDYVSYCNPPELADVDAFLATLKAYHGRELTFESDILRAFKGILKHVESDLGPSIWGIPAFILQRGLQWRLGGTLPKESCRPGIPSWSWAAWRVEPWNRMSFPHFPQENDDDDEGIDHELWELEIFYYRVTEEGKYILESAKNLEPCSSLESDTDAPEGSQSNSTHSSLSQHDPSPEMGWYNWEPGWRLDDHPGEEGFEYKTVSALAYSPSALPPLSHVLSFYTSMATLPIKLIPREPVIHEESFPLPKAYGVYLPGEEVRVGTVEPENQEELGNVAHFIYIGGGGYLRMYFLMVEPIGESGVMRRLGFCCLGLDEWRCANPKWTLVNLA